MDAAHFKERCEFLETNASQIAAALGLNRNTFRYWLQGTSTPVLGAAYAVAEYLETDVMKLWPMPKAKGTRR